MVHRFSTFTARRRPIRTEEVPNVPDVPEVQLAAPQRMPLRSLPVALPLLLCIGFAHAAFGQTADVMLFRLFLKDGTAVVSYGEYARVDEEVVFAMPLGIPAAEPGLQIVTLPASLVDWLRTDRYAQSARYQRYAATRGEQDFAALSSEVGAMLNEIAITTEPARALEIAAQAKRKLVEWPAAHFGYRQHDISDIVSLIDDAVSGLPAPAGEGGIQLSLVADMAPIPLEPVLGMPTARDQVARMITLVQLLPRSFDRIVLLKAALDVLKHPASGIVAEDAASVRRSLESQLHSELYTDERYGALSKRLTDRAKREAASASVTGVERVLSSIEAEDIRLGSRRPETLRALRAELEAQLEAARDLRLRRDQWELRRHIYRRYVNSVSAQVSQLVKAQASLDAVRRLAGPSPQRLLSLKDALGGGADRLQDVSVPEQMRSAHELLINAWRFAESALDTRHTAIVSGSLDIARQASSAAAGSILLLTRAQAEIRSVLEQPTLR
jgi:hypothetical protein